MVSIDMKKIVCIQILLWMSCLINVSAQDSYKEYEQKVYVSSQGDSLQYCLLRPEVEKPGEKAPSNSLLRLSFKTNRFKARFRAIV